MQRLFFALPIPLSAQHEIDDWRYDNYSNEITQAKLKPVVASNFHITLAFLGQVTEQQRCIVEAQAGKIEIPKFSLALNQTGFFQRPKVTYLGSTERPKALLELAKALKQIGLDAGLRQDEYSYTPHLTLFRKAKTELPPVKCNFALTFTRFALFHSQSTEHGVCYHEIASWPLIAD